MKPLLLALETSSNLCSVALLDGAHLVSVVSVDRPRAHAETLAVMIQQALRLGGIPAGRLDAVAVASGPGSFTGLRIGVSAAKGLAFATGAGLVAVDSLFARATAYAPCLEPGDLVSVLLPSRRGEVFAGAYRRLPSGLDIVLDAAAVTVDSWLEMVAGWQSEARVWLGGEAAGLIRESHVLALEGVHPVPPVTYDASWLGRIAVERYLGGRLEDLSDFEPAYLKPFVAKKPGSIFDRLPDMRR